jgi:hypothetical protein
VYVIAIANDGAGAILVLNLEDEGELDRCPLIQRRLLDFQASRALFVHDDNRAVDLDVHLDRVRMMVAVMTMLVVVHVASTGGVMSMALVVVAVGVHRLLLVLMRVMGLLGRDRFRLVRLAVIDRAVLRLVGASGRLLLHMVPH